MEIVKVENVEKTYSDHGAAVHALRGVDFTVNEGQYVVIAGPSGSGKTTLLNVVGSLDTPSKGKVYFQGEDLSGKKRNELAKLRLDNIGFIFQAYNLIPVLTSLENIEFSMMLRGIPEKQRYDKAMEVMKYLEIDELAQKKPNQISGGQQQRVAVARAVVNDPAVVLADEPTANLDSKTGAKLLDMMERMNEERKITFVFSSHDPQVIERAKRLLMLRDGVIEEDKFQEQRDN